MDPNPWIESRTLWVDVPSLIAALLATVLAQDWIASHPAIFGALTSALAAVNILLRVVTTRPIGPIMPREPEIPRP